MFNFTRTAPERLELDYPCERITNQSKKLPGHEDRMKAHIEKENAKRATDKKNKTLICRKCRKTFPMYMRSEFNRHKAKCEQPASAPSAVKRISNPDIKLKTGVKNKENARQVFDQPKRLDNEQYYHQPHCNAPSHVKPFTKGVCCSCRKPDQPSTNAMIFEQISGSIKAALELLEQLDAVACTQTRNSYNVGDQVHLENQKQGCIWTLKGWYDNNLKHLQKEFEWRNQKLKIV